MAPRNRLVLFCGGDVGGGSCFVVFLYTRYILGLPEGRAESRGSAPGQVGYPRPDWSRELAKSSRPDPTRLDPRDFEKFLTRPAG